jgi:hypothetical protein
MCHVVRGLDLAGIFPEPVLDGGHSSVDASLETNRAGPGRNRTQTFMH